MRERQKPVVFQVQDKVHDEELRLRYYRLDRFTRGLLMGRRRSTYADLDLVAAR